MTDKNIVSIHGKEYMTVAGRVQLAHEELKQISITTEVLPIQGHVVVKATVITQKGTFTGISAANPNKLIEKQSPYEVAETSAVGRALGFAGYGVIDGIATADEINKATVKEELIEAVNDTLNEEKYICRFCGEDAQRREGDKTLPDGSTKHWVGYFCSVNKKHVSWE